MQAAAENAASLGPASATIASTLFKAVAPMIAKAAVAMLRDRRTKASAMGLIGINSNETYDYRVPAANHPLLDLTEAHPDDVSAFCSMAGPALAHARKNDWLEIQELVTLDFSRNIVLIGSPEAESLLRLIFDYRRPKQGAGLKYVGETFDAPYRWMEDPEIISAECRRYVNGLGLITRPNWPLVYQSTSGDGRIIPQVGHDNLLQSDLLLITVIPNFLTLKGLESGRKIISIAGTHGVGTRSIELVLKSRGVLRQIHDGLSTRPNAFQIVIEAQRLKHHVRRGTNATRVTLRDVRHFERPYSAWEAANRAVARRFSDWVAEDNRRNRPLPPDRR